jgi:hypothetical protein
MKAREIIQEMADLDVRLESVIWLPGAGFAVDSESDPLEEFRENLPERDDAPIYKQLPELARFKDGDEWPEFEDLGDAIGHLSGFLIQAATPYRDYFGRGWTCSWGYYRTEWLYAASEADILPVIKAWAEAEHAEMKAKSEAKASA